MFDFTGAIARRNQRISSDAATSKALSDAGDAAAIAIYNELNTLVAQKGVSATVNQASRTITVAKTDGNKLRITVLDGPAYNYVTEVPPKGGATQPTVSDTKSTNSSKVLEDAIVDWLGLS